MVDPDHRKRPQVPLYIYEAVKMQAETLTPYNPQDMEWWKSLEAILQGTDRYERERYREFIKSLSEAELEQMRNRQEEYDKSLRGER